MICPKCNADNVNVIPVTETKSKTRWGCGCLLTWLAFLFPKKVSKTHTEAVCQNCGHRWKVSASEIKRNAQTMQALPGGNAVSKLHSPEEPFYKRTWFLVVSGLVLPPLGIALVWLIYKDWDIKKKAIISGIMAIWFVIVLCSGNGETSQAVSGSDASISVSNISG